jgi:hypothetical protein
VPRDDTLQVDVIVTTVRAFAMLLLIASLGCAGAPEATPPQVAQAMVGAAQCDLAVARAEIARVMAELRKADDRADDAALRRVRAADARRDRAYAAGLARRTAPPVDGDGDDTRVRVLPIPVELVDTIEARQNVLTRFGARHAEDERARWAFDVAEVYFIYGHFDEAVPLYLSVWHSLCKKDARGYLAWDRLIVMSSVRHDREQLLTLAHQETRVPCHITGY